MAWIAKWNLQHLAMGGGNKRNINLFVLFWRGLNILSSIFRLLLVVLQPHWVPWKPNCLILYNSKSHFSFDGCLSAVILVGPGRFSIGAIRLLLWQILVLCWWLLSNEFVDENVGLPENYHCFLLFSMFQTNCRLWRRGRNNDLPAAFTLPE